ncbi:MAG: sulfite exporter TauE/SafE family protein [Nitrospirae bacterium]|nr:sulfite exporter TauE/SafE family protein [Nitrospirota bacterium]
MEDIIISPYLLSILFFAVAFAYSSVGLGGGSSYTALMAIFGVSAAAIPMISLTLNLLVTTVGSVNFTRYKHVRLKLLFPFLVTSIPMSYLGGSLQLPKELFYGILLTTLIFVALRLYVWEKVAMTINIGTSGKMAISLLVGSVLGLVAGIVGIGGGIYLVPIIIILGLGSEKEAAACGVIFILLNSVAGLIARLQFNSIDLSQIILPISAVVIGSASGSFMGAARYKPQTMQKILGAVILVAIALLIKKMLTS